AQRRTRAPNRVTARYRAFEDYYQRHRGPDTPSPARVFGLCRHLYHALYWKTLSFDDVLAAAYQVLDGRPGKGRGLLNDFDPRKYGGGLKPEDHFVNVFTRGLKATLRRWLDGRSDRGRRGSAELFGSAPERGLFQGGRVARSADMADPERILVSRA